MGFPSMEVLLLPIVLSSLISVVSGLTNPGDLSILNEFRKGLVNPELLKWPKDDNDPCGNNWPFVYCQSGRVTQIQTKNLGLVGALPEGFNKLDQLSNVGLQNNNLTGMLPSFKGLANLMYVFLDNNNFTAISGDFFDGLVSLEVVALDNNPLLNVTTGWSLPSGLRDSAQLTNLSLMSCNLVGELPEFLGSLGSLAHLKLSFNRISGGIPSSLNGSNLQSLWLNGQSNGGGMSGPIDLLVTMESLSSVWLHGNRFNGVIPEKIGDLTSLKELNVNTNNLVGLIPSGLADLELDVLDLSNNHFMGPIPDFKAKKVSYDSNSFCQTSKGKPCAPEVMSLLDFLGGLNYPSRLSASWSGDNPCVGWLGLTCDSNNRVSVINLHNYNLNGTLSPSIGKLESLSKIMLSNNNITGQVPYNWTDLKSLTLVDLSNNNLSPPLPKFTNSVKLHLGGNSLLTSSSSGGGGQPSPFKGSDDSHPTPPENVVASKKSNKLVAIVAPVVSAVVVAFILVPLLYYCTRSKEVRKSPRSVVIHPSENENTVKIVVANNTNDNTSVGSTSASRSHVIEAGSLVISVQLLRKVTNNFAPENELGKGGFGVVYKGELEDGTKIAVKRMNAAVISSKGLTEFQSEIAVLSRVRHRHLVSLLGYSVGDNEKMLVYEYMPQGALSRHLFQWKSLNLEPLSWKRRLNIALDVGRGMEYLHSLCHESFVHRDLKPSNILLGDDFKAKVSDFGLVKLAPHGVDQSIATNLAGTFGYLAPEYASTGKITTKVDVFSFGVILMELLTGQMALDDQRPEDRHYLVSWFLKIMSDKDKLLAALDPTLDVVTSEETVDTIRLVSELAGHCTASHANKRPDMGHVVTVLAPLVEHWKPWNDSTEEYSGIDYSLPLNQMVKGWQEDEGEEDSSYGNLEDSKGSIPARPTGFGDSFTSADGR